jgi:hypothetical protein
VAILESVGLNDIRLSDKRWDCFAGTPSQASAEQFGARGMVICGTKPASP